MLKDTSLTVSNNLSLNPHLNNLGEDVMGFLNEIQLQYPKAISFASGRPDANFFDVNKVADYFNHYVKIKATTQNTDPQNILNHLGQYNRTKGFINQELVKYFEKDEQINVNPQDILVTVGTQEALNIGLMTLCDRQNDVIIVEDPAYVGVTHFSLINGYEVAPVSVGAQGIDLDSVEKNILHFQKLGKNVKVVYVIADFQNPTGNVMSLENRYRLLELADQYDFLIFEDNAYGDFSYQDQKIPSLKALDQNRRVVYLRSFSKTLYPSLRLGAMLADQMVLSNGKEIALSDLMAKTKGYTSVNTPAITQAIFGGMLYENDFSLKVVNEAKVSAMKEKRDQIIASLEEHLNVTENPWAKGISWNEPKGGFFISIKIPFPIDKTDVIHCAENFELIFTPMSFFYLKEGGDHEIRLAFSNVSTTEIKSGIQRLTQFFKTKI